MTKITKAAALNYHSAGGVPGKISVTPSKPLATQFDLGLAYTPGVAYPVLEIDKDHGAKADGQTDDSTGPGRRNSGFHLPVLG